jgi:hypothetical protein
MRGWEGLKVCQKVPQMPAGGVRGSELELGTFTHKAPCQVRVAPTRGFWTQTAVMWFLDWHPKNVGTPKTTDRGGGVSGTHRPGKHETSTCFGTRHIPGGEVD